MTEMRQFTAQELAEAAADTMWREDNASRRLGMVLEQVAPGAAVLSMPVQEEMANGHGICHGGYIFALADSAFAFAQHCSITYIAPAFAGDRLTATAREVSRRGRGGIYDVSVSNQKGEQLAEFRGHSRTVKGTHLAEEP